LKRITPNKPFTILLVRQRVSGGEIRDEGATGIGFTTKAD